MGVSVNVQPLPFDNTAGATIGSVSGVVQAGLGSTQAFARSAVAQAVDFLDQLRTLANQIVAASSLSVSATLGTIGTTVTPFAMPALPDEPADLDFVSPASPPAFTGTSVTALNIGAVPVFTGIAPTFQQPLVPAALTVAAPTAPQLSTVVLPTAPTLALPDVPTLLAINIPTEPLLNLPAFTTAAPTAPAAPGTIFGFNEAAYTSALLTSVRTMLQQWVDGAATGLDPVVEAALWERGRQREMVATSRKIGSTMRDFARSGFTKPPGAMTADISDAIQEQQSNLVALSREVMIKQADLEQTNRRFAVEQSWKVEEGLIQYQGMMAARTLEAAKFVQQVAIDIYRELVARYGHDVEAFVAQVSAFREALQAELAKLEVYKAEIEAQRLIGTINEQSVAIYRERVTAARAVIDLFTAQVSAANAQATINKTQIEAFAALVSGYEATVRAKAVEYQGFTALMQGEQTKADIFKSTTEAFQAQVGGFRAGVDAQVAAKNVEVEVGQRIPLELYKTGAEVFRTLNDAETARVTARNRTYETRAQVFGAEVQGEGTRVTSEVTHFRADADVAIAVMTQNVEALKANLQKFMQQLTLLVEAGKSGAQVSAQVAAASLAGFNFSAGMHAQGSASESYGASNSYSGSAQVSASQSDVTQNITQTNYNP